MGQKIECRVIELNRSRNNVVLSRRAVLEEERKEQRQEILDRLQPGLVVEGVISNIVDFGAFVEILEGVEGLVHISELAPHHVENPREVVSPGDDVRVKILEIDSERRRLSLSVKRVEGQELPIRRLDAPGAGDLDDMPELGLSEDVFAEGAATEPATTEENAADAEVEIPEGVDDQVEREAEASEGEGETPGSTVDQPEG
jgi:small subunit ribosomal protein S1